MALRHEYAPVSRFVARGTGKTVSLRKAFQFFLVCRRQGCGMAQHHQRTVVRLHQLDVAEMA